jgi:hypothetical protein
LDKIGSGDPSKRVYYRIGFVFNHVVLLVKLNKIVLRNTRVADPLALLNPDPDPGGQK